MSIYAFTYAYSRFVLSAFVGICNPLLDFENALWVLCLQCPWQCGNKTGSYTTHLYSF